MKAALALAAFVLLVSGCGPRSGYQGISFAAGAASAELQSLAQHAAAGDKWAQLELGIRFEEGRGVPISWSRAERLYRSAASRSGGTMMVYVPPVGRSGSGRVMPVGTGPEAAGLPQARERLEALRKRRRAEGAPRRI
jgi:hypothetical protein